MSWRSLLACLAAGASAVIATSLIWLLVPADYSAQTSFDFTSFYDPVARSIAAGTMHSLDANTLTRYPPGFPAVLAGSYRLGSLLGFSPEAARAMLALICSAISSILVYLLARSILSEGLALLAALIWSTSPLVLWNSAFRGTLSETVFTPLILAACALFWHVGHRADRHGTGFAAVGLLAGLSALVRPIAIGVPLLLGVLLAVRLRQVRPARRAAFALMLVAVSVLTVLPWEVYAARRYGHLLPLSSGGPWSVTHGLLFDLYGTGAGLSDGSARPGRAPPDVRELMVGIADRVLTTDEPESIVSAAAAEARLHPLAAVKLLGLKIVRSWYGTNSGRFETQLAVLQGFSILLIILGTVSAVRLRGDRGEFAVFAWLVVLYFWAATVAVLSIVRYLVPVLGLLYILIPMSLIRQSRSPGPVTGRRDSAARA